MILSLPYNGLAEVFTREDVQKLWLDGETDRNVNMARVVFLAEDFLAATETIDVMRFQTLVTYQVRPYLLWAGISKSLCHHILSPRLWKWQRRQVEQLL